jgi:hypothetical protein
MTAVELTLLCQECGATSEGEAVGWRAYGAGGLEDDQEDPDPLVVFFCPECARREFG